MITEELRDYLNRNHVSHRTIEHPRTYTAQRTAEAIHIKGSHVAKTVIVNMDGHMCMAVVPAPDRIDLEKLRLLTGTDHVELARESDLHNYFPDCETGAMPPFGNLYGMEVWVQSDLARDQKIAFNGGTHAEVIQMEWNDFANLVHPCVGDITRHH